MSDITIKGNSITGSTCGISVVKVGGANTVRCNRVENRETPDPSIGYSHDPVAVSTTEFTENTGVKFARDHISPRATVAGSRLK